MLGLRPDERFFAYPSAAFWTQLSVSACLALTTACSGGTSGPGGATGSATGTTGTMGPSGNLGRTFEPGGDPGSEVSTPSLDLSGWGLMSSNWCEAPEFTPAGFQQLDKATFAQLIADYALGWSNPGYETLLGLDEQALSDSVFELIQASFERECRERWDTAEFPPQDMLDAESQQEGKDEIVEFLSEATEIESGETLRLLVQECSACGEPLGSTPNYINAQLSTDGVLSITLESNESGQSAHSILMSKDALVVKASLDDASLWLQDLTVDTRSGEVIVPHATGSVTFVLVKDNAGSVTSTVGVSDLSYNTLPGDPDSVTGRASGCIGMHGAMRASTGAATWGVVGGDLSAVLPGQVQCGYADCGDAELNSRFSYQLGGVTAVAEQPDNVSDAELAIFLSSERPTTAQVGSNVFAQGGPGEAGQGGSLGFEVDSQPEGFLVTFSSPLNMGAAMALTHFSETTRLTFPEWLQDEIFDVTFGGDPVASVFVPKRGDCPVDEYGDAIWVEELVEDEYGTYTDWHRPYEVDRREVEIRSGTLTAEVGSGTKTAQAGQCAAKTFTAEENLSFASDWVDVGFACGN